MLDLTELKEAEKKATQSEWFFNGYSAVHRADYSEDWTDDFKDWYICDGPVVAGDTGTDQCRQNLEFITLSRNLCRPMIEEIERLRANLKILQGDDLLAMVEENRMLRAEHSDLTSQNSELIKTADQLASDYKKLTEKLGKASDVLKAVSSDHCASRKVKDKAREALRELDEVKA